LGDPQGGAGEPHREAASSPKIEVPAQEPQQVTEPRDEQAVESNQNGESSNEAPGGESSGGQRPGPRGVPDGGTPDGTGKPEEPSIGNSPAIPVGGNVIAPVLLERAEPLYPEAMRKTHTEGLVFLQAVISQSGFVEDVRIVKSANPLFDAAAAAALRRWRYKPATLNGKAVRVYLTVSVRFHLH
jgi:TonB family protein